MRIEISAFAEPVEKQLESQGYSISEKDKKLLNDLNRCMLMVHIHGLATDGQHNAMIQKFGKLVERKAVKEAQCNDE